MPTVSHHVLLNAPRERVWAFVTALRYLPLWMVDIATVEGISTTETTAGTTYSVVPRGSHHPEAWIVAEWNPPRQMRWTEYRRRIDLEFELENEGQDTRLRVGRTWPSRNGILDRLLPPRSQQQTLERSLARLQELVALNQDIKLLHGMGDE